ANNGQLLLCVEDALYRRYLEQECAAAGLAYVSVAHEELAQAIAERPSGTLLLQSESAERNLIELSGRLKRLFGEEVRVVLLSADYVTEEEAGSSVDVCLQYPVEFSAVQRAIAAMDDSRRVLLIDDSKLVHSHIVGPLREQGYQVFQAFDGEEGLA